MVKNILIIVLLILIIGICTAFKKSEGLTIIKLNNPYGFDVDLWLKCDWNHDKKRYNINKKFRIHGKHSQTIWLSKSANQCQVWPKVKFF